MNPRARQAAPLSPAHSPGPGPPPPGTNPTVQSGPAPRSGRMLRPRPAPVRQIASAPYIGIEAFSLYQVNTQNSPEVATEQPKAQPLKQLLNKRRRPPSPQGAHPRPPLLRKTAASHRQAFPPACPPLYLIGCHPFGKARFQILPDLLQTAHASAPASSLSFSLYASRSQANFRRNFRLCPRCVMGTAPSPHPATLTRLAHAMVEDDAQFRIRVTAKNHGQQSRPTAKNSLCLAESSSCQNAGSDDN